MKKMRCPACKQPLTAINEPLAGSTYICSFCAEVAIFKDERIHAMTVREFIEREGTSQARIRRSVAKALKDIETIREIES
jgi:hypothetical protein